MKIKKNEFELIEKNAKINRNTNELYKGNFVKRCNKAKINKSLNKLTDEEIEILFKIINNKKGTLRQVLKNYFKMLGIRKDLSIYLITNECIKRNILNIE